MLEAPLSFDVGVVAAAPVGSCCGALMREAGWRQSGLIAASNLAAATPFTVAAPPCPRNVRSFLLCFQPIDPLALPALQTPFTPDNLLDVADRYGTPTYVYAEALVRRQCRQLREHLDGLPVRLLYAMKANVTPAVLRVIQDEGLGLDVVSPGELALARRLDFPADDVLFSANNMTDAEMHVAQDYGVRFNIGELSRLEKYGHAFPGSEVCLRLNPQVGGGHHEHVITAGERSKFGIPLDAVDEARDIAERHDLCIVGLHQHIGSGILDADLLWKAMQVLLETARTFADLRFINFGGGIGVAYRPGETGLDLSRLREVIEEPLRAFHEEHPSEDLTFWFEPGRYLVAEAGVLLTQVNTLKHANGRTFAGTDSGMGQLMRPAVYGAYHGVVNVSNPEAEPQTYDLTGNICESGDLFARERPIPEVRERDVVALLDAGAYGMSMASEYNLRPLPAEVMLREDGSLTLIRRRRTPKELVDRLLEEAGQ